MYMPSPSRGNYANLADVSGGLVLPPGGSVAMRQGVVGEIIYFGGSFDPSGWLHCDGRPLPLAENEGLFMVIGTTFGGDDDTLRLPVVPDLAPGVRALISTYGTFPMPDRRLGADYPLGSIRIFAGPALATDWAACDGRSLPLNQNAALGSIINRQFGGDASSFRLPVLAAPVKGAHRAISLSGPYPQFGGGMATSSQALGEIALWPVGPVPLGWAVCQGQALPVQQNTALYSILGTTFGGRQNVNFNLPKLAPPIQGLQYVIATNGVFPSRG